MNAEDRRTHVFDRAGATEEVLVAERFCDGARELLRAGGWLEPA